GGRTSPRWLACCGIDAAPRQSVRRSHLVVCGSARGPGPSRLKLAYSARQVSEMRGEREGIKGREAPVKIDGAVRSCRRALVPPSSSRSSDAPAPHGNSFPQKSAATRERKIATDGLSSRRGAAARGRGR